MNLCKDCKHIERSLWARLFNLTPPTYAYCLHRESLEVTKPSHIDASTTIRHQFCDTMRLESMPCADAKLFEARKS